MIHYGISLEKEVNGLMDGRDWEKSLPDEWFKTNKYHFDGNGITLCGKPQKYDLVWFPRSLKTAYELFEKMSKELKAASMTGVRIKLQSFKVE